MKKTVLWVPREAEIGLRLDLALSRHFPDTSRAMIQEMVKNGEITIDEKTVKPSRKIYGGERVSITLREPEKPPMISATELDFPILFEDEDIIVVNKPAGLVVHPGAGKEAFSVVSALLSRTHLSPIGAPLRPGVVHRLDKTTSGVMVLAKTETAHRKLAKIFSGRSAEKEYLAILEGKPAVEKGRIEVAIERDRLHRKRMKATSSDKGRESVSVFEIIESFRHAALARVKIETGRTHQIRVHMAYIRSPLLGDVTYGGSKWEGKAIHYLHSHRLSLKHPISGNKMEWIAPLPSQFQEALQHLRDCGQGR